MRNPLSMKNDAPYENLGDSPAGKLPLFLKFKYLYWSGHPDSNRESRVPETRMLAVTPCPAYNQEYNLMTELSNIADFAGPVRVFGTIPYLMAKYA